MRDSFPASSNANCIAGVGADLRRKDREAGLIRRQFPGLAGWQRRDQSDWAASGFETRLAYVGGKKTNAAGEPVGLSRRIHDWRRIRVTYFKEPHRSQRRLAAAAIHLRQRKKTMSAAALAAPEVRVEQACSSIRGSWSPAERKVRSLLAVVEQTRLLALLALRDVGQQKTART